MRGRWWIGFDVGESRMRSTSGRGFDSPHLHNFFKRYLSSDTGQPIVQMYGRGLVASEANCRLDTSGFLYRFSLVMQG